MTIVVNVRGLLPYSFNDKESGRLVEGCNVFYEELTQSTLGEAIGFIPKKVSVPMEVYHTLKGEKFPFNGELVLEQKLGNKGIYTKVVGFKPTKAVL